MKYKQNIENWTKYKGLKIYIFNWSFAFFTKQFAKHQYEYANYWVDIIVSHLSIWLFWIWKKNTLTYENLSLISQHIWVIIIFHISKWGCGFVSYTFLKLKSMILLIRVQNYLRILRQWYHLLTVEFAYSYRRSANDSEKLRNFNIIS